MGLHARDIWSLRIDSRISYPNARESMFSVQVIPEEARLLLLGRRSWTVDDAIGVREDVRAALELLKGGPPIRMFGVFVEHNIEDPRVSAINAQTGALLQAARIDRYGLVCTSVLVKMQARRVLAGVTLGFFDDLEGCANWLGWPMGDLAARIAVESQALAA